MSPRRIVVIASLAVLAASVTWAAGGFQQKANPDLRRLADLQKPTLFVQINRVVCDHGGQPNPEIDLGGTHFGAARGNRRVLVDGVPATQYVYWSDTSVTIHSPSGSPTKWYHEYTFAIEDGAGKILSNQFKVRFPIDWDGASPAQAKPGAKITLYCWGPGPNQGNKVLYMDNAVMQVTGWSGGGSAVQITAVVPAVAAGTHKIYFKDGADKISKDLAFTVL
jgi:hypothetical protein